ncbi:MAG: hypothetical protein WC637_13870, partial [Victivallales bacterium]
MNEKEKLHENPTVPTHSLGYWVFLVGYWILREFKLKSFIPFVFATFAFFCSPAAQNQTPHIGYLYPAGAQAGAKVTVIAGGMKFGGLKDAHVSGDGVTVKSVRFTRPFPNLSNDLKNEIMPILEAMEKGEDPLAALKKSSEIIIARLKKQAEAEAAEKEKAGDGKKSEENTKEQNPYGDMLKIVPGERLVYIDKTPEEVIKIIKALSPPEYQCLCKEVFSRQNPLQANPAIEQNAVIELEIAKNATTGIRELRLSSPSGASNPLPFVISSIPETTNPYFVNGNKNPVRKIQVFPSIVNGQIMPGETDKFWFKTKPDVKYAFSLTGRKLMPYLGDAVPGWFQPVMSIHDRKGKLLAFSDDNLFDPDPVLGFTSPHYEGEYELRVRDSIYRGREDFVYRLKAEIGTPPQIEMKKLELDYEIGIVKEAEKNNSLSDAQAVRYPVMLEGAIDSPGDVDFFRIKAGKGEKAVTEIFARRLDSPLDSLIQVMDANGKILFWNDDCKRLNTG